MLVIESIDFCSIAAEAVMCKTIWSTGYKYVYTTSGIVYNYADISVVLLYKLFIALNNVIK